MKKVFYAVLALAFVVMAGCEDLPSDPTPSQAIVGTWTVTSTSLAKHFRDMGATALEAEFLSDNDFTLTFTGAPNISGTYVTEASPISSTQRSITLTSSSGNYKGTYETSSTTLKLEIAPDPVPGGVTPPDASLSIPNARRNGVATTDFYSVLSKK